MPNNISLTLRLRLEDAVALTFFLFNLAIRIVFRGLERRNLSPADVLIIIPAVSLLVGKELAHYFISGSRSISHGEGDLRKFARPYWEIIRDWFPFLVVLLMYYSLWGDATHLMITSDRDTTLIALDQKLFGFQASVALQRFVSRPLTAWMDFAYFFHILNVPIVACFIYMGRSRERFREMMSGVLVVTIFGLLGYLLVPAIGPLYMLRDQYTVSLTQPLALFNRQMDFMDFARIRRDVFPSLHVGISFLVWLYALRNSRWLFWLLSPLILSLWLSSVYLRFHYLVDILAGLILAPLCFWLTNFLFRQFSEIEFSVRTPAWAGKLPGLRSSEPPAKVAARIEERP